jgi:hypothetical protein
MNPTTVQRRLIVLVAALLAATAATRAAACPFCNAAMQTLSQEIESADVALIAQLIEPMPTSADGFPSEAGDAAKFRVVEVLRGGDRLEGAKEINVVYFGDDDPEKRFFITGLAGVTGPGLDWTTPVPLVPRSVEYLRQLPTLPAEGADRLAFFQEYLEDEEPLLAQDAYDEFARTPYSDVEKLGPRMKRDRLLGWIQDSRVGPSGRRLYLCMLSICGQREDIALLEELMNYDYALIAPGVAAAIAASTASFPSAGVGLLDEALHAEARRKRESLDAMIFCYIKLVGPDGLALVNRLFLGNPKVEYKQLYSAIMALRLLGEENIMPQDKLLESMRLALDHPDLADQVIADLTRWEDWEVMPRLVSMFKNSKEGDWIRPPVASYLLTAAEVPGEVGEQATAALAELEALDPETVKGARTSAAFGFLARAAASTTPATSDAPGNATADAGGSEPTAQDDDPPVPGVPVDSAADAADESDGEVASGAEPTVPAETAVEPKPDGETEAVAAAAPAAPTAPRPPLAAPPPPPPSRIKMIGIPLVAAGVLLAIFAVLLRGADPRSSDENP